MKKIIGAVAAVGALSLALVALTGFHGGCGARHHGRDPAEMAGFVTGRVDDVLDDLDATPEQRARVHAVKDRLLADGASLHGGRREVHDALVAAWRSTTPDAAKLHALVDARIDAMRALAHQAVDSGVEVHGVLTPEQREKLARKAERWHR